MLIYTKILEFFNYFNFIGSLIIKLMSYTIFKICLMRHTMSFENRIDNKAPIEHWASKNYVKRRSDSAIP